MARYLSSLLVKIIIATCVLFMILLIISCSGGSGGGGSDADNGGTEGSSEALPSYDFVLSLLADRPLEISSMVGPRVVTARLESIAGPISGSYDMSTQSITLDGGPILKVVTDLWTGNDGILAINAGTLTTSETDEHVLAQLTVAAGASPQTTYIGVAASAGSVTIQNMDQRVDLGWDAFEDLVGSSSPVWQQQAAVAYFMVGFIVSQLEFAISAMDLLETHGLALEKSKSLSITGDAFTGSPPDGHAAQGDQLLKWVDSGDGDLGPSDDFSITFNDFLRRDASDPVSTLYQGSVDFVGFLENLDEARDVITAIGFVPNPGEPGGIFFNEGFTVYEVEEDLQGTFTIDDSATLTIRGGYSIMLVEPGS